MDGFGQGTSIKKVQFPRINAQVFMGDPPDILVILKDFQNLFKDRFPPLLDLFDIIGNNPVIARFLVCGKAQQVGIPDDIFPVGFGPGKDLLEFGVVPAGEGLALAGPIDIDGAGFFGVVIQNASISGFRTPELYHFPVGKLQRIMDIVPNQFAFTDGIEVSRINNMVKKKGQIRFLQCRAGGRATFSATDTMGSFHLKLWFHKQNNSNSI